VLGGDPEGGPVTAGTIGGRLVAHPLPVAPEPAGDGTDAGTTDWAASRRHLQRAMSAGAGVLRDAGSLADAGEVADEVAATVAAASASADATTVPTAAYEVANLVEVARALVVAAAERTESRGAHSRQDHPVTDPTQRHRIVLV
jgi:L-aspartate oxidase